ncbi:TlpA family protein disulfide reductase [Thiobacter aerophilum]|uniref:TlpA disulfide reductase family protein n=1 Tax=Thiobacter aerophilum TaxID=3121275 RepID=A0ABV0EGT7_9BURK
MDAKAFLRRHNGKLVPLLLLGLIAYLWFRPPAWVQDLDGTPAPVRYTTLDGRSVSLEDLRGKVVLVNFWATWCPYCRHEMPAMERFYRDWRGRGFEIIAFSLDEAPGAVRAFMRENGYSFPAAMADVAIQQAFGGVSRLPTSYILDRQGRLRHKVHGQVHYARLEGLVAPLLAE